MFVMYIHIKKIICCHTQFCDLLWFLAMSLAYKFRFVTFRVVYMFSSIHVEIIEGKHLQNRKIELKRKS